MGFIRTRHHGWNAPRHPAGAGLGRSVPTSGIGAYDLAAVAPGCDEIVEQTALRTGLVHRVLLVIGRSTIRTVRSAAILTYSLSLRDGRKTSVRGPRHRDDTDGNSGTPWPGRSIRSVRSRRCGGTDPAASDAPGYAGRSKGTWFHPGPRHVTVHLCLVDMPARPGANRDSRSTA